MESLCVSNDCQFRGVDYAVSMCPEGHTAIKVEVEDRSTSDQWRASFDVAYIEDLTQRTGNYKQFQIFVSMLESAILQTSESVSLDLLTYADLESLRSRKAGTGSKCAPQPRSTSLTSKRYLILTYTVEFDRIHYPLPLPYMGKPDPRALQETIRELKEETKRLKQHGTKDFQHKELEKLKRDYDILLQEKEDLEADFIDFKRQVQNTTKGAAAKEIRVLKGLLKHMEQELLTEKTKQQRKSSKLNQDYRTTFDELEELRASERNLRVRVKSLSNELNVYKRGRNVNRSSNNSAASSRHSSRENPFRASLVRDRTSSRENSLTRNTGRLSRDNSLTRNTSRFSRDNSRLSAASRESSLTRPRTLLSNRRERSLSHDRLLNGAKQRSLSRDKERGRSYMRDTTSSRERLNLRERARSTSRDRSFTSTGSRRRSPSPSPIAGGGMSPRFDPTAYQKERERKRKELDHKLKRQHKGRNTRTRSSAGSLRSSSLESLSDIGVETDASENRRMNRVLKVNRTPTPSIVSSPESLHQKPVLPKGSKILASTPDHPKCKTRSRVTGKENRKGNGAAFYDRSEEISEIDERLNRLQQFMKQNLQC